MPLRKIKDNLTKLTDEEWIGQKRDAEYMASMDIDAKIEPILTIDGLYYGECSLQAGKENKYVISFAEESVPGILVVRPLICNSGNRDILKKLYGGLKNENLIGKKIQLWIDHRTRSPKGGVTDGIKIREFVPKSVSIKCELCGKEVTSAHGMTPDKLVEYTFGKYGKKICAECATDLSKANGETK